MRNLIRNLSLIIALTGLLGSGCENKKDLNQNNSLKNANTPADNSTSNKPDSNRSEPPRPG